ncbi:Carbonic anhydrase 4, partial [Blattella germanica]
CCQLTRIEHPFTSVEINSDCLLWLEDHEQASGFYTFPGSLTMPIHSKNVIWIMYSSPINISHKQVDEFRHLQEGYHFIKQNYRELQPFDDRPIYYYP